MTLIVSSLGAEEPWLLDLGSCAIEAGRQLQAAPIVAELVKESGIGYLFINVVVMKELPHYYLAHRGQVRAGRDTQYIVNIRSSACVGTDVAGLTALVVRACAVALFDVARQCDFKQEDLAAWFCSLSGNDRFEMP